jgi:outer membrane protein OmpA-like peptidoglycan-associated protein
MVVFQLPRSFHFQIMPIKISFTYFYKKATTMTVRQFTFAVVFALAAFTANAQDAAPYRSFTPKDQIEVGLDLGLPIVGGDFASQLGFGGGLHVRKALDNAFSLRGAFLFASAKNEEDAQSSSLSWLSGDLQAVVALNNLRFDAPNRKLLLNAFAGVGFNNYSTEYTGIVRIPGGTPNATAANQDATTNAHLSAGVGIAYRISPKFNIGLEYTVYNVFGSNKDLLDSDQNINVAGTTYGDLLHFPHLSLNFNIGKDKAEPLYWTNPLGQVGTAIAALEARPIYDPTDTDADGIIDAIDDEDNSPAGARVNSRGVTLDSDADGVADFKDKEPYSAPGYKVDGMGVAQVPKPITEGDVNRIVDAKLANFKLPAPKVTDWFLPIVNFADNSYAIGYDEYAKLYQVAGVVKQNSDVKLVVTGATDKRGSEKYNDLLSYNRAQAVIDFLVKEHGIARDRLVLDYSGESMNIVPGNGSSVANRRAEFRVAKGETDKTRPEGKEAGKGGSFKGNKDAGY